MATDIGDGTQEGNCPTDTFTATGEDEPCRAHLRCLSSGECRICKFLTHPTTGAKTYEGCVITSMEPICDADRTSDTIEVTDMDYMNADLDAKCKACKKSGNNYVQPVCSCMPKSQFSKFTPH